MARKSRARTLAPLPPPHHGSYQRALLGAARLAEILITHALGGLMAFRTQRLDADDDGPALREALKQLRQLKFRLGKAPSLTAARELRLVAEQSIRQANYQVQHIGVVGAPFTLDASQRAVMNDAIRENAALIKSIPRVLQEQVESVIADGIARGLRVEEVADSIERRFQVSRSRARFIARDQVAKLNGALVEARNRALGITRYRWITSRDERVRPWHRRLDGTIQEWAEPPVVDKNGRRCNPGEDFNCRCVSAPLVEDILDAFDQPAAAE